MGFRYIYAIKERWTRKVKIGITHDIGKRKRDISDSLDEKLKIICASKIPNADKVEKWLHRRYKHRRFKYRGSGRTEWFKLSAFQRLELRLIIWGLGLWDELLIFIALMSFLYYFYGDEVFYLWWKWYNIAIDYWQYYI